MNGWSTRCTPASRSVSLPRRALLAIYTGFIRVDNHPLAPHDAMAFRTFAWYVTPWGLAAAVAGMVAVAALRFWRDPAFFLTLTTFSLFFFYKTRIVPEHFWASRLFLAVILPGALIVAAGLARLAVNRGLGERGPALSRRSRGRVPRSTGTGVLDGVGASARPRRVRRTDFAP